MSLMVPFQPADEPIPLKVALDHNAQAVILLNCPRKTRITYMEMVQRPRFFTKDGDTIAVNAANGVLVYAATPNTARGWYDCELLMSMQEDGPEQP